jgi:hypothetical protein
MSFSFMPCWATTTIHTQVLLEDSKGALYITINQPLTICTKYFHTNWHHFWNAVIGDPEDTCSLDRNVLGEQVDTSTTTKQEGADDLTKSLPRESFENNRRIIQGW